MWNWQSAVANKYTRENIFTDMLKEESLLFDMAKEDVAKILQKTNYSYIVQKMDFDDIYPFAVGVTKKQVVKFLNKKRGWLNIELCIDANKIIIKKIIERIVNNTCNLFDNRYRTCILKDLIYFNNHLHYSALDEENDPLDLIIKEEELELKNTSDSNEHELYRDFITTHLKIETNGQTAFCFEEN